MSILDKAAAAITPMESADDRADARSKARDAAQPGDWLSMILQHHVQLEDAFSSVRDASDADRRSSLKKLGILLMGHAIAEEAAIYPALAETGQSGHADHAYDEQATVKMDMAELEKLDPSSQDFLDKLESIREAVAHHMYEEEGTWYPELEHNAEADQQMLTKNYQEQFDRYVNGAANSERPALSF